MGFYHPSVLVEDAKRHGVGVVPVEINRSQARCRPEGAGAFRVGFNYVRDLGDPGGVAIVAERANGEYRSFADFLERLRGRPLNPGAVRNLVMVGAFDALGESRRELLWKWQERWRGRGLRRPIQSQAELGLASSSPDLPELTRWDTTRLEYRISDLSTGDHLVSFWRDRLRAIGVMDSRAVGATKSGRRVRVAGLVIVRQAPSTANKIRFFTLEDEFGHVNVTIKPEVYDRYRRVANSNPVLVIDGMMQRQDGVSSVLASHIEALEGATRESSRSHDYK
jgi:error-prone DNA polymerase